MGAKLFAVLKKDALTSLRYRSGFVLATLAQAAQLATFYFLSLAIGPQFRPDGMPYLLFLLVGTGFYTFLVAGMHSFLRTIQESQQAGTLEVLLTTSTPAPVLVVLNAISAFASGMLQFAVCILAAIYLFGHTLHINVIGFVIVFSLSLLITLAIGLCIAGLQVATHKGSALLWLLGSGSWLVSGTLFPTAALPRVARVVASCIPFTHSLSGMRLALLAGKTPGLLHEIEVLALFSLMLVPIGVGFFSWMVQQARQNGSLCFY